MVKDKYNYGMRLFRRENGIWYAELQRGVWRSLKTGDEREANARYKELQTELAKDKLAYIDRQSNISLKEFLAEYQAWVEKNKQNTTAKTIAKIFKKFLLSVGDKRLAALSLKDMDNFVGFCRDKENSPVTINIAIRTIKAAVSKAVEWEYLRESPIRKYKQIKFHTRPPAFIEDTAGIDAIFKKIENNKLYRLMFGLYVYTGARRSELWKLQWEDVKENHIIFRERKNFRYLKMPILPKLKTILNEWTVFERKGKVIKRSLENMGKVIKTMLKQSGLGHLRPHDLRHTFASQLVMAGVDLKTIQELLGHSSYKTTEIYAHLVQDRLSDAISKLPY